jgi:NarL family two-component system sensor histidine kinase YdfH
MINDEIKTGAWVLIIIPAAFFTILYTTMYVRQAQARERAQGLLKELETANRQLSQYAAQVEDLTIASERQRMARELHDTLSQGLAGLILQLEAADAHLAGNRPEKARFIVRETMEQARFTLADARRAIDDLRSTGMPGLAEAARQEAGRFITATGIPCEVEIVLPVQLPDLVTEAATRAISEGLTNVARHARAKNARMRIAIAEERNELEIEINDDGIGFNPDVTESGHYGLLGMRERVRLAGGRLEVHSQDGKGTQLVIHFPLEKSLDE